MKTKNGLDKMEKLIKFNLHVQYQCFIQSCLFVQYWPQISLAQCWLNLNNATMAFAATRY